MRCRGLCGLAVAAASSELTPIGHVRSCFAAKFGTPRQGCLAPAARATLRLDGLGAALDPVHALDGLDAYSHVWLIWLAPLNGPAATRSKVQPPRLRGARAGLFATRTPYRPNPLGLSLVKLDAIAGDTLHLSGVDLVDGTPVVDLKPFIPAYDAAPALDGTAAAAAWASDDSPPLRVSFSDAAAAQIETVRTAAANAAGSAPLLGDAPALRDAIVQSIAADPRPLYRWRRQQASGEQDDCDGDGLLGQPPRAGVNKYDSARADEYDVRIDGVCARVRFDGDVAAEVRSVAPE